MVNKFVSRCLLLVLLFVLSCSKDDVSSDSNVDPIVTTVVSTPVTEIQNIQNEAIAKVISPSEITASVLISVKDEFGASVNGAKVTIAGETMISDNGIAVFRQIELNKDFTGVKVSHPNFITAIKNFTPTESNIYNIDVVLFEGELESFSASSGANLQFDSGVILDFQPNSFVNADGSIYDGNVSVNTYYHNTTDSDYLLAQPGALVGLDGDQLSALATEGMITVDLTSASGNEVFIKEGESVKVTMPADADAPATIDLWHLNEKHGIWVKTGVATKNGAVYEFEVTHFSTYNLDFKVDTVQRIDFIVKSSEFSTINETNFQVFVDGIPLITVVSDGQGRFTLLNAPKGEYSLKPILCDGDLTTDSKQISTSESYEFLIPNFNDFTTRKVIVLSGRLTNCENYFESGETIVLKFDLDNTEFEVLVNIESNGFFRFETILCTNVNNGNEIAVEIIYETDGFKEVVNFELSPENLGTYSLSSSQSNICDLATQGASIDIDEELLIRLKSEFNLSESQVITAEYAKQIKAIRIFNDPESSDVGLNNLDFNNISTYFLNLKNLRISYVQNISNFDSIESLDNLEELRIFECNLTDISSLSRLDNLRSLFLMRNNIKDFPSFSELDNLVHLDLSSNDIVDISNLSGLDNLGTLELTFNNITDISGLSGLDNLKTLDLEGNNISDISSLSVLDNLEILRLGRNNITDISGLSGLDNLKTLELDSNNISDIPSLFVLGNLEFLNLSGNNISDISSLSGLDNLKTLRLDNNNISDISSLSELESLETLTLGRNNISDISSLSGLDNLVVLHLSSNNFSDISPLFSLTELQELSLFFNRLEQNDVDELRRQLPNTSVRFF